MIRGLALVSTAALLASCHAPKASPSSRAIPRLSASAASSSAAVPRATPPAQTVAATERFHVFVDGGESRLSVLGGPPFWVLVDRTGFEVEGDKAYPVGIRESAAANALMRARNYVNASGIEGRPPYLFSMIVINGDASVRAGTTTTVVNLGKRQGGGGHVESSAPFGEADFVQVAVTREPYARYRLQTSSGSYPTDLMDAPRDPQDACTIVEPPFALATLPSGEIFVAAESCARKGVMVASLKVTGEGQDEAASKLMTTPCTKLTDNAMVAASPSDVYLGCWGGVAHFDGKQWTMLTAPLDSVSSLALADNTLWATASDALWAREGHGEWKKIPTRGLAAKHVYANGKDVWVLTPHALLGVHPPKAPYLLDAHSDGLPMGRCKDFFVQIATVPESTAKTFDFPSTRAALKGHPELDALLFVRTDDDRFGAITPDKASGESLVALVREKLKGSMPVLRCERPTVARRIPMAF